MLLANSAVISEAAGTSAWKRTPKPNSWQLGDLWSAFPEFANSIIERAGLYGRRTKWEHWPDSGSESSEKRCWVPEWPHSAARSVLSQLEGRLFGTEQTRGNLRVSGLLVRLGLIGTAYRIFLPVLWRDPYLG